LPNRLPAVEAPVLTELALAHIARAIAINEADQLVHLLLTRRIAKLLESLLELVVVQRTGVILVLLTEGTGCVHHAVGDIRGKAGRRVELLTTIVSASPLQVLRLV